MSRIEEKALIVPALHLISEAGGCLAMRELIPKMTSLLKPSGEDMEILQNRTDTRFSQKVRNLVSHKTLERHGLAKQRISRGPIEITQKGRQFLIDRQDSLHVALNFGSDEANDALDLLGDPERDRPPIILNEQIVTEGTPRIQTARYVRTRSQRLRNEALNYYAQNGQIYCHACSFDYSLAYPIIGTGYIEIHHLKPIVELQGHYFSMEQALENVRPLCANCHRMVHKKRPPIPVDKIQEILSVSYNYGIMR